MKEFFKIIGTIIYILLIPLTLIITLLMYPFKALCLEWLHILNSVEQEYTYCGYLCNKFLEWRSKKNDRNKSNSKK